MGLVNLVAKAIGLILGTILRLVFTLFYRVEEEGLLWVIRRKFKNLNNKEDGTRALQWLDGYIKALYYFPPARYFFFWAILVNVFTGSWNLLKNPSASGIVGVVLLTLFIKNRSGFLLAPQSLYNELHLQYLNLMQVAASPYGSAKWIDNARLVAILNPENTGLAISGKKKDTLAIYNKMDLDRSFKHLLILGTSGSRKTQNIIIPNITTQTTGSLVIMDPKGELYEKTAQIKKEQGYTILKFDPLNIHPGGTSLFNPLHKVKKISQAKEIAHIVMSQNQSDPTDPFWRDAAESLLAVLIMLLKTAPNGDMATFSNVKRILIYPDTVLAEFVSRYCNDEVQEEFIMFMRSSDKVRQSILSTMLAAIKIYSDEHIRHASTAHNIDLATIRQEKTALYICVPEHKIKYLSPYTSLVIQEVFDVCLDNKEGLPVFFLLDEFANIGFIPRFQELLTTLRSRDVSVD